MGERRFMSVRETAAYMRMSKSTLDKWRCRGIGPRWVKVGQRKVAYALDDVEAWMTENTRQGTLDASARTI